ncbi:MAG: SRPBCC family protein [Planctomycetes bacterium]|nr:SRPBCC family protein [Planctomycetota bacterium]
MLKIILIVIVLAVVGVCGFALTKPDTFQVERSATMRATPDELYPMIADFHRWAEWSPWEKLDPAMTRTHSGAASGTGATYAWKGNSDVGEGRMEITESAPPSKVTIKLDFIEPFASSAKTEFTLSPQGDSTTVRWVMSGENNFMSKVMCVFVSMDSMIGKDFETGLANLKAAAEK